jgi:hypothetical protein
MLAGNRADIKKSISNWRKPFVSTQIQQMVFFVATQLAEVIKTEDMTLSSQEKNR